MSVPISGATVFLANGPADTVVGIYSGLTEAREACDKDAGETLVWKSRSVGAAGVNGYFADWPARPAYILEAVVVDA